MSQSFTCAQQLTLAFAPVGGVSVVTRHARLAVGTRGEVTALLAHAAVHARAVAITLACCKANGKMHWVSAPAGWGGVATAFFLQLLQSECSR